MPWCRWEQNCWQLPVGSRSTEILGLFIAERNGTAATQAVGHIEQLGSSQAGYAQYMRLRQAYIQLTTHQPNSAYKQARRGSLSFAV